MADYWVFVFYLFEIFPIVYNANACYVRGMLLKIFKLDDILNDNTDIINLI